MVSLPSLKWLCHFIKLLTFAYLAMHAANYFTALPKVFSSDLQVCSSLLEKGVEEKHISHALKNNDYPEQFIIEHLKDYQSCLIQSTGLKPL